MADTEKQIIILEGTHPKTLYTKVEEGKLEDGTPYEKRQAVSPRGFTTEITDSKGKNLDVRLDEMQEQLDGSTTEITQTVNDVVTERASKDIATKEELTGYLPLTGGTLADSIAVGGGYGRFSALPYISQIVSFETIGNSDTLRALNLHNNGGANLQKALQLQDKVGGVITLYNVLHTGNSKPVIVDTSAPTDTTAVWIDKANKVVKAYIDGAWTAVS